MICFFCGRPGDLMGWTSASQYIGGSPYRGFKFYHDQDNTTCWKAFDIDMESFEKIFQRDVELIKKQTAENQSDIPLLYKFTGESNGGSI